MTTKTRATIDHLRKCQHARACGFPVNFTTDPAWLVHQAINRRAGWPDDPGCFRGSCLPVRKNRNKARSWDRFTTFRQWSALEYPRKAIGETFNHLRNIAQRINSRVVVRDSELGEWRKLLKARIPGRLTTNYRMGD